MRSDASFRVRPATPADRDAFTTQRLAICREVQGLGEGVEADRLAAETRAAFDHLLGGGRTRMWLAVRADGGVVGSAALHVFERFPSVTNPCAAEGYVSHVYVVAPFRRRGVGTALVEAIATGARESGLRRVRLHATESGRALYATLGFRLRSNDMELCL